MPHLGNTLSGPKDTGGISVKAKPEPDACDELVRGLLIIWGMSFAAIMAIFGVLEALEFLSLLE